MRLSDPPPPQDGPTIPRLTSQTLELLRAFIIRPFDWRYGYELSRATGLRHGTIYPQLLRLESAGLLEARWEQYRADIQRRRHMFRLTEFGMKEAPALLSKKGLAPGR